ALAARMPSSAGPASDGSVVALIRTTRSPLAPSIWRPLARIASMCSRHRSTAQTSWPASANRPAYTDPIAPAPTIAIFMRSAFQAEGNARRPGAVSHLLELAERLDRPGAVACRRLAPARLQRLYRLVAQRERTFRLVHELAGRLELLLVGDHLPEDRE